MFVEYLWGIETDLKGASAGDILKFVEYLWGIETFRDQ